MSQALTLDILSIIITIKSNTMKKLNWKLYAEILAFVGLLTTLALICVGSPWWFVGFLIMLPNTIVKFSTMNKKIRLHDNEQK